MHVCFDGVEAYATQEGVCSTDTIRTLSVCDSQIIGEQVCLTSKLCKTKGCSHRGVFDALPNFHDQTEFRTSLCILY
jgi:hypothetical protein